MSDVAKNKQMDMFARLLAKENITIQRASVSTASFDIKHRVMTLPIWKDMDAATEQMLILHEVGHALLTPLEDADEIFVGDLKYLKGYVNILEDARIERLMKVKYPGSKRTFYDGYKVLNERDFFDLNGKFIDEMILVDRMNIHFKIGSFMEVPFNEEEMVFVNRAANTNSLTEVIELAKEVYTYSKSANTNNINDLSSMNRRFSDSEKDDDDQTENDLESDSFDVNDEVIEPNKDDKEISEDFGQSNNDEENEENEESSEQNLDSITDKIFQRNLIDCADVDSIYQYFEPKFEIKDDEYEMITSFHTVLKDFKNAARIAPRITENKASYQKFMTSTNNTVAYLVKEFEMKKAASRYKRQQISKSGSLNLSKLYQYSINSDIFKQSVKISDDKKHSMTFLLDWSGSMSKCMHETIMQIISLVSFCRRINIPFNVFAFTDVTLYKFYKKSECVTRNPDGVCAHNDVRLIELFNDKMTNQQFANMSEALYSNPWIYCYDYRLSGTPLNSALIYMIEYLDEFVKKNGTEKNTFILLTDGQGNGINNSKKYIINGKSYSSEHKKYVSYKSYLRDPVTKKQYKISQNDSISATNILLDVIRNRNNMNVIRFFVMPSFKTSLKSFMVYNELDQSLMSISDELSKKFRKDGYLQIDGILGVDKLFLVSSSAKISDEELSISGEMTAQKISSQLKKTLQTSRTSRVLLSRFIDQIA